MGKRIHQTAEALRSARREAKRKYRETHRAVIRAKANARRQKHPEEMRRRGRDQWRRNAEKYKASTRARYAENLEESRLKAREHAKRHRQKRPDLMRDSNRRAYAKNPEGRRLSSRKWQAKNLLRARANNANRRSMKLAAGGKYTRDDVVEIFKMQRGKCAICKTNLTKYHVDHVMPLSLGGDNNRTNLQLLCPTCNSSKGAKHPIEFMRLRGLLC
jgi:5-methylcytosine-specific restriction endonuclease McrA